MKYITNQDVFFVHEVFGPDILHRVMSNFVFPQTQAPEGEEGFSGPDLLSKYINPNGEIWALTTAKKDDDGKKNPHYITHELIQKWTSWGYTVETIGESIDVHDLNLTVVACFDGKNNDGKNDGIDFPYDPDCTSPADETE